MLLPNCFSTTAAVIESSVRFYARHHFLRLVDIVFYGGVGHRETVCDHLGGRKTRKGVHRFCGRVLSAEFQRRYGAGGNVGKADADTVPGAVKDGKIIIPVFVEHTASGARARRDHADHVPLYDALCKGGVFGLLADGHLIALCHQPGDIGIGGMERHAAHGGALFLPAVAPGEHQLELTGGDLRILVKHLVEVAEAIEKKGVLVIRLDCEILLHHGGKLRHLCNLSLQGKDQPQPPQEEQLPVQPSPFAGAGSAVSGSPPFTITLSRFTI